MMVFVVSPPLLIPLLNPITPLLDLSCTRERSSGDDYGPLLSLSRYSASNTSEMLLKDREGQFGRGPSIRPYEAIAMQKSSLQPRSRRHRRAETIHVPIVKGDIETCTTRLYGGRCERVSLSP